MVYYHNCCRPCDATARIGGLFSSFVGTLHLDYKKSIFQQIKTLRAVKLKKQQTSKLQWFGLPNATAEAGPPIPLLQRRRPKMV